MHRRIIMPNHFSLRDIGNAIKDVTKVALAPATVIVNKIKGQPTTSLGLETGIGKAAEKSGAGKALADTVRLGTAPVTNAISSVLNKKIDNGYVTGVGKVVGKLHDTGNQGINIVAKSFADTVSGGLVSKGKNWIAEKIDPKGKLGYQQQSAYKYGEMNPTQTSGIKVLDKAASYVPVASAVVGTLIGAKSVSGIGGKDTSNIKPTNVQIGSNVLKTKQPIVTDTEMKPHDYQVPLPAGVHPTDLPNTGIIGGGNTAMASFGTFDFKNPFVIGGIVLLVVIMLVMSKSNSN